MKSINLKDALKFSKNVLNQTDLIEACDHLEIELLKGKKFSESLLAPFPAVVRRLMSIGENTGKLAPQAEQLAKLFEEESEKKLLHLTTFLQPVLLAFIGLIVGLVVLSILVPLTDVGSFTN